MQSYRDRYDRFLELKAHIIAISGDKSSTQASFRREIGAEFAFVADNNAELLSLFGVKMPLVDLAKRTTFVIGRGRKILHIDTGSDAIDTNGAATACSLY